MDMFEILKELETLEGSTCSVSRPIISRCWLKRQSMKPHIEQHRPQSYTIGDAIDIAVQRSHAQRQNPKSKRKDKKSTKETYNIREQKNKGKGTIRVEMPELLNT